MIWILVLLCNVHFGISMPMYRNNRLLLNDPAQIMDRLSNLEHLVQQQGQTIQSQSAEIHHLQATVNCSTELKPAFYVILGSPTMAIGNSATLKFDVVRTNIGGGYDAVTGVFIVPIPGTYHFTSVVYSNGADDSIVQLNKNKELIVNGYSTGDQHATTHTMNALLTLNKGDHIYVQHRGVSSDVILGALHSSFSGFMISEMN